jgi:hypothetical protein
MQQPQLTAIFHLTGIEETYVAHWFVKEGDQVCSSAPLVTLHHPSGVTFTLRTPLSGPLSSAVLQQILVPEGTAVSASDVLAILAKTVPDGERAVAQLEAVEPVTSPYFAETGIDMVVTSSSRIRDHLFKRFPRFHSFYFHTHPLLPLLNMGCFAIIVVLSVLQIHNLLAQVSNTPASPGRDGGFFLFTLAGLILLALAFLAYLILTVARLLFLRRP